MSLLKLHGSLTWYWSGIDAEPNDQIYDIGLNRGWSHEGLASPYEQNLTMFVSEKRPMVVPPAATKNRFYDNAVLSSQWKLAAEALREATELVIIGYSVPKSDLVTRSLLLTNFGGRGERVVPVDRSKAVLENLRDLWGGWKLTIVGDYVGTDDAVERFVSSECQ